MSLRRKSCDVCFRGRRKCNLQYPTCETCRRTKKTCSYAYSPINEEPRSSSLVRFDTANVNSAQVTSAINNDIIPWELEFTDDLDSLQFFDGHETNGSFNQSFRSCDGDPSSMSSQSPSGAQARLFMLLEPSLTPPRLPQLLGPLGELMPLQGSTETWQWVMDQLKSYPQDFARRAQNIFIHLELYDAYMPRSIQAAFAISSSSCSLTVDNQRLLFRVIDTEVLALLEPLEQPTLLDELAKIQALLLYQTIRLFHGGIEQRALAEQQQDLLMKWALKLSRRCRNEVRHGELEAWQTWIVAECVRRTAVVTYMLYGMNSMFREGICIGFPTLAKLPVSARNTWWDSARDHQLCLGDGSVLSYEAFTSLWLVSTEGRLRPFEELLVTACRGVDVVAARN